MEHLTEESLLCHVQCGELEEVVNAVLEHHTMLAGALRGVDELPYLLHVCGSGHLNSHMLAVLHCIEGQGHVMYPVGGDVDEVNVVAVAHLLIGLSRAAVGSGTWTAMLLQNFLACLHTIGLHIAETLYVGTLNLGKALYGTRATHTQANKSHTHHLHGRSGKTKDVLLSCGTFRNDSLYRLHLLCRNTQGENRPKNNG